MRRRWWMIAVALIIIVAAGIAGYVVHFEKVVRPRLRAEAGPIRLSELDTDVPAEILIPPATQLGNASAFYVEALNSYIASQAPYLKQRTLNPYIKEPPVTPHELHLLLAAARIGECNLYTSPPLVLRTGPSGKPWPLRPAVDTFVMRVYVDPLRILAQAALNEGRVRENRKRPAEAETIYQAVARLAVNLRQHPGSLMDIELSIELERRTLHYLMVLYNLTHQPLKYRRCVELAGSVERLQVEMRAKYTQLDNPEAAMIVLRRDASPLWRMEAAVALMTALRADDLCWLEARPVSKALAASRHDPDQQVRLAVAHLYRMKPEEFSRKED